MIHGPEYWEGFEAGLLGATDTAYVDGRMDGAAVAFGLMGMADAIRETVERNRCRPCTCGFFTRAGEVCVCCGRHQPSFRDAEERAKCPEAWVT